MMFHDEESRWNAVIERDKSADGKFYYGVLTTGVFCRPGCPARLPRRENVRFFATSASSIRAGFRPCTRCRPHDISMDAGNMAAVQKARRILEEAEDEPTLAALARSVGISRFHFHRIFKAATGKTPKQYRMSLRFTRTK
jgi:AraC family transcriptional regulator of adaptative response/methylated-DNA-[protein]-cysteine methyltransferase